MATIEDSFKLLKNIKDEKFNVDRLETYSLLIQVGVRDIQVAVVDTAANRCLTLEDYILNHVDSVDTWRNAIQQVFDTHHYFFCKSRWSPKGFPLRKAKVNFLCCS